MTRSGTHLGGSALLFASTNATNVLHLVFHVVMARLLGPGDYGLLAALFAAVYAFSVVGEAVQTVVAREAARTDSLGELRARLAAEAPRLGRVALALAGLWAAAAVPLGSLLRTRLSIVALFGVAVVITVAICVVRGLLLGLRRFAGFGAALLVEGIVKLAAGVGVAWLGWGLHGVGGAVAASFLLATATGLLWLRDLAREAPRVAATAGASPPGYALSVLLATGTLMAFFSLDVMLARALLPAAAAGQYSLAALIGKGAVLGTIPLARAMFPFAARAGAGDSRRVLAATMGLLALCLVPGLVLVACWPGAVTRLAGGPGYEAAAGILLPVAAAFSLMAISQTLVTFRLAAGQPRFAAWIVLALAGEAAVLVACRGSLAAFAGGVLAAHAGLLVIAALFAAARPADPPRGAG